MNVLLGLLVAIAPFSEPLHWVVRRADWCAQAQVVTIEKTHGRGFDGLEMTLRVQRKVWGSAPAKAVEYREHWPERTPDGKVEAPIWTGSGYERQLRPGDERLFLGDGTSLLRVEPLDMEKELLELHSRASDG